MTINYVTDEIRALIGMTSAPVAAADPVSASEIRRFHHATLDPAPRYFDEEWAGASRYGGLVAPAAFPFHAFRRAAGDPDPLERMGDPDFDGLSRQLRAGLPPIDIPLKGLLNAGYDYEFFRYAKPGERIEVVSTYRDIYQRDGRSGPMVFVVIEDTYRSTGGELLLRVANTNILR